MEGGETNNGNDSVVLEQVAELLEEFKSEEVDGFSAAGEDIVHDVVILGPR